MIREPLAIGSWVVVVAASLLPGRLRPQTPGLDPIAIAAIFFLSAAATRYWLQETRTREQILAFVAAAAVLGYGRTVVDGRAFPTTGAVAGAVGAAAGALAVKVWLEGWPV